MKLAWFWPLMVFISTVAVLLFALIIPATPLQPFTVMWFLILSPGMAWIPLLRLGQIIIELSLGIAVGLAIDAIVVGIFLYAHAWYPPAMLITLSIISLIGTVMQCYQLLRSQQSTRHPDTRMEVTMQKRR